MTYHVRKASVTFTEQAARLRADSTTHRQPESSPRATQEDDGQRAPAGRSFAELGVPTEMLDKLHTLGIREPFPIQAATLPDALAGRDVLGRAQTGSGKTLAFGLALLARLRAGPRRPNSPRGLVLVPTRELAIQVADALTPLAKASGLRCRTAVGGMSFAKQADALRRGVDLLIATPGRLADHVRQGTCKLSDVEFTTLDEADQMTDMGFLPQITEILDQIPRSGQRMLFSASLDGAVHTLVRDYLGDPAEHSVAPATASVSTMEHHIVCVDRRDKHTITGQIAARDGRSILFVRTKQYADLLAERLREVGVSAIALHGGKTQGQRNKVLETFKDGAATTLVATDVAARGIHIPDVSLVLHVDPPAEAKDYLHRAGRTARAGESGTVVTLITPKQRHAVRKVTEQAGVRPNTVTVTPGDDKLKRVTGARTPSGTPIPEPYPERKPVPHSRRVGSAGREPGRAGSHKPTRPTRRGQARRRQQPQRTKQRTKQRNGEGG